MLFSQSPSLFPCSICTALSISAPHGLLREVVFPPAVYPFHPADQETCSGSGLSLNYSHASSFLFYIVSYCLTPPPAYSLAWVTVGCLQISHSLPHLFCPLNLPCLKSAHLHKDAPLHTYVHIPPCTHLCVFNSFSSL